MRRALVYSLILHLLVLVVAVVGLPSLRQPLVTEEEPVVVDLVTVADLANQPPARQIAPKLEASKPAEPPAPRPQPPEPRVESRPEPPQAKPEAPPPQAEQPAVSARPEPRAEPRPAPAKPEPPKPERAEPKPERAEPKPEPKAEPKPAKAEAKSETKPEPPKPEPKAVARAEPEPEPKAEPRPQVKPKPPVEPKESKPQSKPASTPERKAEAHKPAQQQAKTAPAAKPETAKPEAPRTEQKPEPASDFAAISKAVRDLKQQAPARHDRSADSGPASSPKTAAGDNDSAFTSQVAEALRSTAPAYNKPSLPVTSSEIDAVRRQIERCWNLPEGSGSAGNLVISIRVEMNVDGTPRSAVIENAGQSRANPQFQAAADSARRAVLNPRCHPFKLPLEKFEHWRTMTLIFNPKEIS